ncbi:hypothetical protein O181_013047 [Austropuccinia psidii MF-1]|uniref:Essential protein Yae1 N-terminal domain-containing protein n=1 Tax=Austropuccinia psidii MF-1 TaxID=1389203 RepID=A0A9Q3BXI7_9BASI|nr:hypothetical protein [Austropuccinia psidii MF-1]
MNSLDSLNHLEERFFTEGYQAGLVDGEKAGKAAGRELGEKEGYKLWEELGYYLGQAQIWESHINNHRLKSKINNLITLIEAFPTENSPDSHGLDLLSQLNTIRSSYRLCCANMGLKPRIKEAGGLSL